MTDKDHNDGVFFDQTGSDAEARKRAAKRLTQDRQPGTGASSATWVNWLSEEEFLGQPWDVARIPLRKLEQMRRDPILAFALMFVKVPLIRAPWYIKCSDPKIASAVDASLRKIYGRFILAYCNSFDFGFSPMVKRFEYDENPDWMYVPSGSPSELEQPVWTNKSVHPIVWKPFTALNPRLCTPHWDSKGQFNGIDFNAGGNSLISPFFQSGGPFPYGGSNRQADIPLDWALWATNEKDSVFGSYWGYPRIGYAYRFWWAYWYRFGVFDRAFEKWGDPPVIVYHPNDPFATDANGEPIDFTSAALALAEKARSGANIAMPSSVVSTLDERPTSVREWAIEQMSVKTDFNGISDAFRYLDIQKLRSVMVPEQALVEGEGGTSSRNVASTFGELFQEAQAVVKEEIDDHLNRWVIPQFVQLNFGYDAPKAEIVTTGFQQTDMETMTAVMQLVGQRKLLTVVDERELAERMGIPTVSRAEMNKRLEELANEAAAAVPPPVGAGTGVPGGASAGVTQTGLYYEPRDRVVLGEKTTLPYLIEKVDELPVDEPAAYFDAGRRTLLIRKDADPEKVTGYLLGLTDKMTQDGESIPDDIDIVLAEFKQLAERIEGTERNSKVEVQLTNPEQEDPTQFKTRRRVIERDEDGLIKEAEEWKERIDGQSSDQQGD